MNSMGHRNGDDVQHNSRDTGVRNQSFVSGEENMAEPLACSKNGHDFRWNSGKQTTNDVKAHNEETMEEKSCEPKQEGLKFSKMSHKSKYMLVILAVESVAVGCLYSLPSAFFPREATKKGVSPTVIGLVFSCYQLVNFLACPLFGSRITQLGAKFTYVSGILIAGVSSILFGFLDQGTTRTSFIVMSFLVRSVEAVGCSAFATASFAIISNEFPNHIASMFATLETCTGLGLMLGPAIGAALYEVGGFGMPFWSSGALICCSGLTVLTCLPQPLDNKMTNKGTFFSLLRSMMVWITCLSIFAPACAINYMNASLSVHLDTFGLTAFQNGLFFVVAPGLYAALAPLLGFISDRKDIQSPLLIIGSLVCAISFLLTGPSPLLPFLPREIWVVSIGLVLFGLATGCSLVPTVKCLFIGARELGFPDSLSTFGMVSGLFYATYSLGAFIGPTIGGAVVDKIGFEHGSTIISGFFLSLMLVTWVYFGQRKLRKKEESMGSETEYFSPSTNHTAKLFEQSEISEKSQLVLYNAPKKSRLGFDS